MFSKGILTKPAWATTAMIAFITVSGCSPSLVGVAQNLQGELAINYVSTSPSSPSNSNSPPVVIGRTSVEITAVKLFSDSSCSVLVGEGSASQFTNALSGIAVVIPPDATTEIYATISDAAGHSSGCKYLTTYIRKNTPPAAPVFTALSPASPNAATTVTITGTASSDTSTLKFYSDSSCTTLLGQGAASLFAGSGIPINVASGVTTTIYAQASDLASNVSACALMTNYANLAATSLTLAFGSTTPVSPSKVSNTPSVIGTASSNAVTINLYSDPSCSTQVGTGSRAQFIGAGITATLPTNQTTSIYGKAQDAGTGGSACTFLTFYQHKNTLPAAPSLISFTPASPSSTVNNPVVKGLSSVDTASIKLYSDSGCSAEVSSGTKAQFEGAGLGITLGASPSTMSVYAQAQDAVGNLSSCALLGSYTFDSTVPAGPAFVSTSPASPNNSSTTPLVKGTVTAAVTTVDFYSNAGCSSLIGSGSKAQFEASGIVVTASANATTPIYAVSRTAAGASSACTLLVNYVHKSSLPSITAFTSFTPASPSSSATPIVRGTASADTATVTVYRDASCTLSVGTGTKAQLEGAGITVSAPENSSTQFYIIARDSVGNQSVCAPFGTSYTHDGIAPAAPAFVSTTPASPNNASVTPAVRGTSSADTVSVSLFKDSGCLQSIGSGAKATFEGAGITTSNLTANATTEIYAKAADASGNESACTYLADYENKTVQPAAPSFASFTPSSPSKVSNTPVIKGTVSADTATVSFHGDVACASAPLGAGTKAQFISSGVGLTLASNAATAVYAKAIDAATNESACALMGSYRHDNTAPLAVVTVSHAATYNSLTQSPAITWSGGGTDVGGSGLSRYEYSIGTSAGATDIQDWTSVGVSTGVTATGLALASSTQYFVNVKVIDNAGNEAAATSSAGWTTGNGAVLAINPNTKTLATGNGFTFTASGGQPPYTYTVTGSGTVDSQTGYYLAPMAVTGDTVTVTDAAGAQANATVTIVAAPSIAPQSITLTASSDQTFAFTPSGGVGAASYSIVSGPGSVDAAGVFTAGTQRAATQLRMTDSLGNTANAVINHARIRTNGAVTTAVTDGTNWYLGGDFTAVNPWNAPSLAILNPSGTPQLNCDLKGGFNGTVNAVIVTNNAIYVGGVFTKYQGQSANRLAKLNKITCALDTTFSPPASNGFNSTVKALVATETSLYVGGYFTAYRDVADSANRLAKLDLATGAIDTTFSPVGATANGFEAGVFALAVTDTSLYVGGEFLVYKGGGVGSTHRIAKLDLESGALDVTFTPLGVNAFNQNVNALLVNGTSLYVGGNFTTYRGGVNSARRFAKLDLTTGALDTAFSPPGGNGFNNTVNALAADSTSLYVGGTFTSYKITADSANRIAKLDLETGAIDTTFSPVGVTANGFNSTVLALTVIGTNVYVGGGFSMYKGVANSAISIAKLDTATGAIDTSFIPPGSTQIGFNGSVNALVTDGTGIYAGGTFRTYGGQSANRIAKLDGSNWKLDTTFSPPASNGFNSGVTKMILNGGALYVGGSFTAYRGIANSANYLAKLDASTGAIDTAFSPVGVSANGFNGSVYAMEISGGSLYAGGSFNSYKGVADSAYYLAKLDLNTGAIDTAFSPAGVGANGFNSGVYALHVNGTSLYVGGAFTAYKGVANSANRIAKLDLVTGAIDAVFSPVGATTNGFNSDVRSLTSSGTALYVGGQFITYRNVVNSAQSLAKLDLNTGAQDSSFVGGLNDRVQALLAAGDSLYIGGRFTEYLAIDGSARSLAKVNLNTGAIDTTFSPLGSDTNGFNNYSVNSFTIYGSNLFVGGGFTFYRDTPAHYFAPISLDVGELGD